MCDPEAFVYVSFHLFVPFGIAGYTGMERVCFSLSEVRTATRDYVSLWEKKDQKKRKCHFTWLSTDFEMKKKVSVSSSEFGDFHFLRFCL